MRRTKLISDLIECKWNASYTIEGAIVISICILVLCAVMLLAFNIYNESIGYLESIKINEMDVVETFRQIRAGKTVMDGIINK